MNGEIKCTMCKSKNHTLEEHLKCLHQGRLRSENWRQAVIDSNKKNKTGTKHTDEEKRAISEGASKAFRENPEIGKKLSEHHRNTWANYTLEQRAARLENMSKSLKGKKFTPEHLAALQESNSKPRSEDHCRKLSESTKGRRGTASTPEIEAERVRKISETQRGHVPRYGREPYWYEGRNGRVAMRSNWEVALAKHWDRRMVDWQYEPRHFDIGQGHWFGTTYTPDFYLPLLDIYVEVKGYYSVADKRKVAKFQELYPAIKWVLVQKVELNELGVQV